MQHSAHGVEDLCVHNEVALFLCRIIALVICRYLSKNPVVPACL